LVIEYQTRETLESKLAKDADLLDQILLLKEYDWTGSQEAKSWLKGFAQRNLLSSPTAKALARKIRAMDPSDWWADLWTSRRR
jgi:putative hydrolase of HD superfamily